MILVEAIFQWSRCVWAGVLSGIALFLCFDGPMRVQFQNPPRDRDVDRKKRENATVYVLRTVFSIRFCYGVHRASSVYTDMRHAVTHFSIRNDSRQSCTQTSRLSPVVPCLLPAQVLGPRSWAMLVCILCNNDSEQSD